MKIADFMVKTGTLRQKPDSWKDYFFTTVHGEPGT
jgi:NitT/TauT family transport system substrate-binding protein